jgi:hypothetical protein
MLLIHLAPVFAGLLLVESGGPVQDDCECFRRGFRDLL